MDTGNRRRGEIRASVGVWGGKATNYLEVKHVISLVPMMYKLKMSGKQSEAQLKNALWQYTVCAGGRGSFIEWTIKRQAQRRRNQCGR